MPEICRFFGIVISMPPNDHLPPHFHASYSGVDATIEIESNRVLTGKLPPRILGFVTEWTTLHREELRLNWARLRAGRPTIRVAPLE